MTVINRVFIVDGKPFLPLGSEFLTQSGYSVRDTSETEEAFRTLKFANGIPRSFRYIGIRLNRKRASFSFPARIH